jgi:aspartate/tyrosine/aromatic aminotransferase
MLRPYHIFKKDAAGAMIWIEAAKDLMSAQRLAKNLSRYNEGKFVVIDQKQQVVASFNGVSN